MLVTEPSRLVEGRLPEMVPLGEAGSGSLRLWLITSPAGVCPDANTSPACGRGQREMPRWSAERRDVLIARDVRRLASVLGVPRKHVWVPRKHPASLGAPLPLA